MFHCKLPWRDNDLLEKFLFFIVIIVSFPLNANQHFAVTICPFLCNINYWVIFFSDMASFTDDQESYGSRISQFSSRVDQIPGIADGEMPVVPAQTEGNYTATGRTTF